MDTEAFVQQFFIGHCYSVDRIPREDIETPDFFVFDDTSSYLVELKTKFPSDQQIRERREELLAGKIHQISEQLVPNNTLSGIIKKANKQLKNFNFRDNVLRIVWLFCTGHLAEPRMEQFQKTLYGSATLVDWNNSGRSGECFFFYTSEFYRYRDVLDGAIVSSDSEGGFLKAKLLLNPLSTRYEQMKSSSLLKHFGNGVIDPSAMAEKDECFIVEGNVDRDDRETVINYLIDKYDLQDVQVLKMNFMSGAKLVPSHL